MELQMKNLPNRAWVTLYVFDLPVLGIELSKKTRYVSFNVLWFLIGFGLGGME